MAKPILSEALWQRIAPAAAAQGASEGRAQSAGLAGRAALTGILFALKSGIPWEMLLRELGCGSCASPTQSSGRGWRWTSPACPSLGASDGTEPDRPGKLGSKRHLAVDARGQPLAVRGSAANGHDSRCFIALLETIPAMPGLAGRPRRRPDKVHADKGYDYPHLRRYLHRRADRPPRRRVAGEPRSAPLSGRAQPELAQLLPAAARP